MHTADIYHNLQPHFTSHAAVHLGRLVFPLFALALELPEDYFQDKASPQDITMFRLLIFTQTKHAAAIMGVLHYPPQTGQVDDRVMGIGAHTEYVSTILHIDRL